MQNLPKRDAGRPHIYLLVVSAPQKHLRCPVEECARYCEHVDLLLPHNHLLGDAEVDDFYFLHLAVHHDIVWLDISVADSLGVHMSQCFE